MAVKVLVFEKNSPHRDVGVSKINVLPTAIKVLVSMVKNVKYRMIVSGTDACLLLIMR